MLPPERGLKEVIVLIYPGLFSAWRVLATEQRRSFVCSRSSRVRDMLLADRTGIVADLRDGAAPNLAAECGELSQEHPIAGVSYAVA